jgi:hypothetical protein
MNEIQDVRWYPVPDEVVELFDDKIVSEQCRDKCIKSLFKAKRAIYYGREARKAERKAWQLIYDLYPDLEGKNLTFEFYKRAVRLKLDKAPEGLQI